MKIRQGFVSNSSSASFVIKTKFCKSAARMVLRQIHRDWIDAIDRSKEAWEDADELANDYKVRHQIACENLKRVNLLLNGALIPYTFNSEGTFMWEEKGCLLVNTANNHRWSQIRSLNDKIYDNISHEETFNLFDLHRKNIRFVHLLTEHYWTYPEWYRNQWGQAMSNRDWKAFLQDMENSDCGRGNPYDY